MPAGRVQVQSGQLLCYRIFDIADEVDLEGARDSLSAATKRLKLTRAGSEYLQLPDPPLNAELGQRPLGLSQGVVTVDCSARIYSHGAVSIILSLPIPAGTTLEDLIPQADELYDSPAVEDLSRELSELVRRDLGPSALSPHTWEQSESYTVIFTSALEGDPTGAELLQRVNLARLLLGERDETDLSAQELQEVTQTSFSYTEHDLAVIDWNGAFVHEPSGSMDIPDVLEICNAQLLELRYYDELLDQSIQTVYDGLQAPRATWFRIFRSPYRRLARRILATLLEMSEFIERVENSLKIIGDFYLARVYEGALKRLRIRQWQASVTRKQQMLNQVYTLLKGEVDTDRALTLEAIIVFLIVTEIVLAFARVL